MIKQQILSDLKKVVGELGYPTTDLVLSIPSNPQFGDYSTNIALQLAKLNLENNKHTNVEIAKRILSNLGDLSYLSKVEVAGPGFINFFIKDQTLISYLSCLGNLSRPQEKINKKVMVEFTDPNPFKEFHIGHVFSNAVGESLARLFEARGCEVRRVNYFGDVGMHVAKSIWGLKQKLEEEKLTLEDLQQESLKKRVEFLGNAYVKGAQAFEASDAKQKEIEKINLLIYIAAQKYLRETSQFHPQADYQSLVEFTEQELVEVRQLFEAGRIWSLDYFESIYAILGTKFDGYYPESIVGEYGLKEVRGHIDDGIFFKNEGAIVFEAEKAGLHNRVFINSLGLPTYEAKELGLAFKKYQDFTYDRSIIVTGSEINEYFKVLMLALSKIYPQIADRTTHIGHGMVRMVSGKMSSRKGNVLTFDELYEAVKSKIEPMLKDFNPDEKMEILKIVSVGAIKFAMLKHQPEIDTIFDIEKSVALEGDSGPYVQYTYARTQSILSKTQSQSDVPHTTSQDTKLTHNLSEEHLEEEERLVLRQLIYFSQIVEEATISFHPNILASYLLDLAKQYNLFYQKYRILDSKQQELRLAITLATSEVLKKGLYLLGIEAPSRM